VKLKERWIT